MFNANIIILINFCTCRQCTEKIQVV